MQSVSENISRSTFEFLYTSELHEVKSYKTLLKKIYFSKIKFISLDKF
jgi:hypothetical protein